jgi:PTH2 family peptidyl-tRNA hydrolase
LNKGKIAAQCGHAALGAYKLSKIKCPSALKVWESFGQAKIAVKIDDVTAMEEIKRIAEREGLITYIVEDAGRTQIAAGSKTVLAIGPAPESILKNITGHLKLL